MSDRVIAFLSVGSNLGVRIDHLRSGVQTIARSEDMELIAAGPVYVSRAHVKEGQPAQPDYLNTVISISTSLLPTALMRRLQTIEARHGRDRAKKGAWTPRTLDIDILTYGNETVEAPELTIPHPALAKRRFVLQPMADIAPLAYVPEPFDATVSDLLAACRDAPVERSVVTLGSLPSQTSLWPAAELGPIKPKTLQVPDDLRYIAIEGVIGAGKSTLARLFAERFEAGIVLEEFEENPFLERFYENRARWAFQTQLAFLASRFRQQQELAGRDLFQDLIVTDYAFDKDRIFARLNLSGDELALYDTMFGIMQTSVPKPDLVVYLQCTTDRLMDQIRARGRSYEEGMDRDYIAALNDAYNAFFFHYDKSPLLIVNAARMDFVRNAEDLEDLFSQIVRPRYPGTTFYNPSTQE